MYAQEPPIEEPQEQNDDEEEQTLTRNYQGGYTTPPSQPLCVVDKSGTIDAMIDTTIVYNNELDKWAKETTLQCNGEWIVGTKKVNVRDLLTLWQNEKKCPRNE
jgi:hypothetical protein